MTLICFGFQFRRNCFGYQVARLSMYRLGIAFWKAGLRNISSKTSASSIEEGNARMAKSLEELNFVNRVLKYLPVDEVKENTTRTVRNACFSRVTPTPLKNPKLVCHSLKALELLDLNEALIENVLFVEYFAGNAIMPGSETASHCYCGHQFGK